MPRWSYQNEIERFEVKLNKQSLNECWEWIAYKNKFGYGVFRFDGAMGLAHRFAYDRLVRPLRDDEEVDHICFNRSCCNPQHLQAVSHQENIQRSVERNRQRLTCKNNHDASYTYIDNNNRMKCRVCRREQVKRSKNNAKIQRNIADNK